MDETIMNVYADLTRTVISVLAAINQNRLADCNVAIATG
jgi:hypothetical protein